MAVNSQKIIELVELARRIDHAKAPLDEARFDRELARLVYDDMQMVFGAMKLLNERRPFSWTHHDSTALRRFKAFADEIGATYQDSDVAHPVIERAIGPRPDLTTVIFFPPSQQVLQS
jgi:hypothetical protein